MEKQQRNVDYFNISTQLQIMKNSYIGYAIELEKVQHFIDELRTLLSQEDFLLYRKNQATRDAGNFHITVITPSEYSLLCKLDKVSGELEIAENSVPKLIGLGRADKKNDVAYFVVVEWPEMQEFRKKIGLENKDFHITIGFNEKDIFDVKKDKNSLFSLL